MAAFCNKDTEHGRAKRVILHKTLQAWFPIYFNRGFRRVNYIDGFSAAGVYGETELARGDNPITRRVNEVCEMGSPLIALHDLTKCFAKLTEQLEYQATLPPGPEGEGISIQELLETPDKALNERQLKYGLRPPLMADIVLVEKEADVMQYLRNNTGAWNSRDYQYDDGIVKYKIHYKQKTFQEAHQEINENFLRVKDQHPIWVRDVPRPTFAFIDPCGYSHTPMDMVQNFLGENKSALINLMVQYFDRFKADQGNIDSLFGCQEWRRITAEDCEERYISYAKLYEEKLRERGATYTLSFAMKDKSNNLMYYLIFATNDKEILSKAKEAFNRVTQEGDDFKFNAFYIKKNKRTLTWLNIQNNEDLAFVIWEDFRGREAVRVCDINDHVTLDTPYIFRKAALVMLYDQGMVSYIEGAAPAKKHDFPNELQINFASSEEEAAKLRKLQNPGTPEEEAEGIWFKYQRRKGIRVGDIKPRWKEALVILYDQGKVSYIEGAQQDRRHSFPDDLEIDFALTEDQATELKHLQNPETEEQEAEGIWFKYQGRQAIMVRDIKPKWKTSLKILLDKRQLHYDEGHEPRRLVNHRGKCLFSLAHDLHHSAIAFYPTEFLGMFSTWV